MDTPAPGTYDHDKNKEEGHKFSFYGKIDETSYIGIEYRKTRGKPGPGTYQPDFSKTVKSNGSFSFRGKLDKNYDNGAPGPGAYKA